MADTVQTNQPVLMQPPKQGILDQTLGDILQNNPQAQQVIMQQTQVSPEKFQELLGSAQQNNLMQMKIGDLFKNGIMQQAVTQQQFTQTQQVAPGQLQQLQQVTQNQQQPQKLSLIARFKNWLSGS